jgi:predicted RND superfamily exporter protein
VKRIVTAVLRARFAVLVAITVAVVVAGRSALSLGFDLSFRTFFAEGQRQNAFATSLEQTFGNTGGSSLVAVLQGPDVFRVDVLRAIAAMSEEIEAIRSIDRVYGLATIPVVLAPDGALSIVPATTLSAGGFDPARLREVVATSPLYVRRLASADGTTTAILALLHPDHQGVTARAPTITAFQRAIAAHLPPDFTVTYTGYPIAEAEYARLVWRDFVAAEAVALVLMAIILFASFRTWPGVVLPLAVVVVATVLTLGFMTVIGQAITFTNSAVPLLILVIGIGEVAFFLTRYYEEAERGGTAHEIVVRTAVGVVPPGLIAAATTSAGFLSLSTGHIRLTRDLGVAVAFGILATFAAALLLVPVVLSWVPPPARGRRPVAGWVNRFLDRVVDAHRTRARPIAIVAGVLAVVALAGATRVHVAQYATAELPPENPVRVAQDVVDRRLSGTFETLVGVHARDGGSILRPEMLGHVEAVQAFLAAQPHVAKTWSIVDFLKELHVVLHDGDPSWRRVPDDTATMEQYLLLLESGAATLDLAELLDDERRTVAISVGTDDLGTAELLALHDRVQTFVATLPGQPLEAAFAGDYWNVSLGADSLVRDLLVSTLTSFVIVFALVGLFLRSWRLTLLSIPPNLLPLLSALGVMGFAGYDLRVGTSILLPTTLGVAVDATVHFLARVREEWRRTPSYDEAIRGALLGVGRAMLFSSSALVVGFLCFHVPDFLVFAHVGTLGAVTLGAALLSDLFVTPALVRWGRPFGDEGATSAVRSTPPSTRPLMERAGGRERSG